MIGSPSAQATGARTATDRAEALSQRFPPLLVAADRVASTVSQGVHGRRRVGQGETFWQFRRYQPGDDAKLIDWRASGKGQQLFVRENEWEAAQSVWLWCDGSASMDYASAPALAPKGERARLVLLAVVNLLLRGGERVALLGEHTRPQNRRNTLHLIAERLLAPNAAGANEAPFEPLPRYGHAVFISDFLAPIGSIERYIGRFVARGVRGHLVQVLDPAETSLPFKGRARFSGMEDEADQPLLGRVESVRDRYLKRLEQHTAALSDLARAARWSYTQHLTSRPPEQAVLAAYVALTSPLETFE